MRILADENCDSLLVRRLRESGHDVDHIRETARGASDDEVLEIAARFARILLTHDLDFGIMAERRASLPPAIVLLRLSPLKATARAEVVVHFLEMLPPDWHDKFYVIEPGSVRSRLLGIDHKSL